MAEDRDIAPSGPTEIFGNAPRIGETHEPADSPSASSIESFGGAPRIAGTPDKGERAVNPNPASSPVMPDAYGGAPNIKDRYDLPPASGSGDNTGAGASKSKVIP
jgi:hypothetical protein